MRQRLQCWKQWALVGLLVCTGLVTAVLGPAHTLRAQSAPAGPGLPVSPLPLFPDVHVAWPAAGEPPLCQFASPVGGLAAAAAAPAPPASYTFAAPRVIDTRESSRIIQWLPDNRRILIERPNADATMWLLELLDTVSGQREVVGNVQVESWRVHWLPAAAQVVYEDYRPVEGTSAFVHNGFWTSSGALPAPQRVVTDTDLYSTTLDSAGGLFRLQTPTAPDAAFLPAANALLQRPSLTLDVPNLSLLEPYWPTREGSVSILSLQPMRSPDLKRYLLMALQGTYLVDTTRRSVCRLDLGRSEGECPCNRVARLTTWSPDGRWLAMMTLTDDHYVMLGYTDSIDLTVLDSYTGASRSLLSGWSVYEIEWAPDSRHFVVLMQPPTVPHISQPPQDQRMRLTLYDAVTGRSREIWPQYQFGYDNALAWSGDGKHLAVACPVIDEAQYLITEYRLCLIDVTVHR